MRKRGSRPITFDVPAIDNEFEALAQHLGIADDNELERSSIESLGQLDGIRRFKHLGVMYVVARHGILPGAESTVCFNSGWYAIQQEEGS